MQNTAIQLVFWLHYISDINNCTFAHLLIVPLCVASVPLLTPYFLCLTLHLLLTLSERDRTESPGISNVWNEAVADEVQFLIPWEIISYIGFGKAFRTLTHNAVLMLSGLKPNPEKISMYNHAMSAYWALLKKHLNKVTDSLASYTKYST